VENVDHLEKNGQGEFVHFFSFSSRNAWWGIGLGNSNCGQRGKPMIAATNEKI
jgi:hypothetical protein